MRKKLAYDCWQYDEQQEFFDEVADRLGVVCYRPTYHGKDGDKNTALFYTKEDEAHNRKVDKQIVQYSRSEAQDRHITDESCIYRDHFWSFENSDRNGRYDCDFGNFGQLDLRRNNWRDVLEGAIRIALVRKRELGYLTACGGAFGLREADEVYNGFNREMIEAMKLRYGKCFLGNVNLRVGEEPLTEYIGQKIYNGEYSFCVPEKSTELEQLVFEWGRGNKLKTLDEIGQLIKKLGGYNFIWT